MAPLPPPCQVFDDFLEPAVADGLLSQVLASAERFEPARVRQGDRFEMHGGARSALRLPGRVGVDPTPVVDAVHRRFEAICAGFAMATFEISHTERSVVAHNNGHFYKPHIDMRTAAPSSVGDVRVLSCVYYLHRQPAGFSGGELALHGFGEEGPGVRIAPVHNRLAVFPSFVLHEVLPVACPSGAFADGRFSINVWLRKGRTGYAGIERD